MRESRRRRWQLSRDRSPGKRTSKVGRADVATRRSGRRAALRKRRRGGLGARGRTHRERRVFPRAERSEHGAELSWGNGAGVGTEGVSAWGGWRMRERENDGPGVPAAPAQATLRLRGLVDENAPPRLA